MNHGSLDRWSPPRRPALFLLGLACFLAGMVTMIVSLIVGYNAEMGGLIVVLYVAFVVLVQKSR